MNQTQQIERRARRAMRAVVWGVILTLGAIPAVAYGKAMRQEGIQVALFRSASRGERAIFQGDLITYGGFALGGLGIALFFAGMVVKLSGPPILPLAASGRDSEEATPEA